MKFSQKDIKDIAELARLELTTAELSLYGQQLSSITTYIERLQKLKTNNEKIKENTLTNVWREDKAEPWDLSESEDALNQAEREAGLIKVKRVL